MLVKKVQKVWKKKRWSVSDCLNPDIGLYSNSSQGKTWLRENWSDGVERIIGIRNFGQSEPREAMHQNWKWNLLRPCSVLFLPMANFLFFICFIDTALLFSLIIVHEDSWWGISRWHRLVTLLHLLSGICSTIFQADFFLEHCKARVSVGVAYHRDSSRHGYISVILILHSCAAEWCLRAGWRWHGHRINGATQTAVDSLAGTVHVCSVLESKRLVSVFIVGINHPTVSSSRGLSRGLVVHQLRDNHLRHKPLIGFLASIAFACLERCTQVCGGVARLEKSADCFCDRSQAESVSITAG